MMKMDFSFCPPPSALCYFMHRKDLARGEKVKSEIDRIQESAPQPIAILLPLSPLVLNF
jgi:hypothetical protein